MANLVSRLTSTGIQYVQGQFDEVNLSGVPQRLLSTGTLQVSNYFDEVNLSGVPQRLLSTGTLQVSNYFDEITLNLVVTSGLVLYLNATNPSNYNLSSNTWYDISGSGYNANFTSNGTNSVSPRFNSANTGYFDFSGSPTYAANTGYTQPIYTSTTSFTWNIWIKSNSFGYTACAVGNRGSILDFVKLDQNFTFEYFLSGGQTSMLPTGLTTGVWYNICIVKNNSNFYYYVNGVLNTTMTNSGSLAAQHPFYVGGDPVASEWFPGSISIVGVYNRALSLDEITQNFNALKSPYGY